MKQKIILILSVFFVSLMAFGQNPKEMKSNLQVIVANNFDFSSPMSFDRKNPNKHGWDKVNDFFTEAFIAKGFKVTDTILRNSNPGSIHHYVFVIEYDYGYKISAYKMQYKNMTGQILDIRNNSEIVGSFSYDGRYNNSGVAEAIASRLANMAIVNGSIKPKKETQNKLVPKSKEDRLREIKDLLDKDLITKEDYQNEKKKILEEQP